MNNDPHNHLGKALVGTGSFFLVGFVVTSLWNHGGDPAVLLGILLVISIGFNLILSGDGVPQKNNS